MALYDTLPVFKAGYDLLIELFGVSTKLSREYKYTVGEELKKGMLTVLKNIYKANLTQDKLLCISTAREEIELVRLQVRLLKDLRQLNLTQQVHLNQKIELVSRQLAGWEGATKKKRTNENTKIE